MSCLGLPGMSIDPSPATPATRTGRLRLLAGVLASRLVNWCREDGYWYLTSMAAHAIGLVALAMISLAIPRALMTSPEKAPSFDEATVDNAQQELGRSLRGRQRAAWIPPS